jgi:hypothetical protein
VGWVAVDFARMMMKSKSKQEENRPPDIDRHPLLDYESFAAFLLVQDDMVDMN